LEVKIEKGRKQQNEERERANESNARRKRVDAEFGEQNSEKVSTRRHHRDDMLARFIVRGRDKKEKTQKK